jgi:type IV pilus assembly protein PilO
VTMRFGLREFIFFVVLLAVPVASFFYLFKPRNDEIRQARAEIDAKQAKLDRLAQAAAKIDDMQLAIEQGRQSIQLIEAKLPSEQGVDGILEQVWQIAKRNKLTVKSVKSQAPVPAAQYMELPLKVVMEGGFDGFYQFLLELETLPRITRIHEAKLNRLTGKTNNGQDEYPSGWMKADFTLSIYFQPQPSATPPANTQANGGPRS